MNIFQFKPVGHGLFYTGQIGDNFNFVYDCGSQNICNVQKEIDKMNLSSSDNEIDFVVISHLHRDHFSGLPFLFAKFKINRIYLPYLGEDKSLIKFILFNSIFNEESDFTHDNIELFYFMCRLYGTSFNRDDREFKVPKEIVYLGREVEKYYVRDLERIEQNEKLSKTEVFDWKFIFINRIPEHDVFVKMHSEFNKEFQRFKVDDQLDERAIDKYLFELIRKGNISKIRDLYLRIFGSSSRLNLTSTVLIHYPEHHLRDTLSNKRSGQKMLSIYLRQYRYYKDYYIQSPQTKINGNLTLLTGDALFDSEMINRIQLCMRYPKGLMQVPPSRFTI